MEPSQNREGRGFKLIHHAIADGLVQKTTAVSLNPESCFVRAFSTLSRLTIRALLLKLKTKSKVWFPRSACRTRSPETTG